MPSRDEDVPDPEPTRDGDDDAVANDPRRASDEDGHLEADDWWERQRVG